MPIHDWTRVPESIFLAFHHAWIGALAGLLNVGPLPSRFYALVQRPDGRPAPAAYDLHAIPPVEDSWSDDERTDGAKSLCDVDDHRLQKCSVVVRHTMGDGIAAVIEILTPGDRGSWRACHAFMQRLLGLTEARIHVLVIDPLPPGPNQRPGVVTDVWGEPQTVSEERPPEKPLTAVAFRGGLTTPPHIEHMALGDPLPQMPLFLEPEVYVKVPLEETYRTAFEVQPERWRRVLQPAGAK